MSLCDTCRSPGACCQGFVLSLTFDPARWKQHARKEMKRRKVPFYPVRQAVSNPEYVLFDCRWLGADGRCTQYERRPQTCISYDAGSNSLCGEHVQTFMGIPVVHEARP